MVPDRKLVPQLNVDRQEQAKDDSARRSMAPNGSSGETARTTAPAPMHAIAASESRPIFMVNVNASAGSASTYPGIPSRSPKLRRVAITAQADQTGNDASNRSPHDRDLLLLLTRIVLV